MSDLVASRWRKFGKDRVYVNAPDGSTVACLDLVTGALECSDAVRAAEVNAVLTDAGFGEHLTGVPGVAPLVEVATGVPVTDADAAVVPAAASPNAVAPAPQDEAVGWTDLALNRPGQGVREVAVAELAAMKDRSRFGTFVARAFDVHTDERAWRRGAEGEEAVGARLAKLEKRGWRFLHSVPVGKGDSDIDHVAIGPGGVFTINTKNHIGKKVWVGTKAMRVGGRPYPYLLKAAHEAERACRLLTGACGFPVFVTPLIVLLADELSMKQQPDPVRVLGRRHIANWLKKRPQVLTAEQVDAIFDHARRSTTWTD